MGATFCSRFPSPRKRGELKPSEGTRRAKCVPGTEDRELNGMISIRKHQLSVDSGVTSSSSGNDVRVFGTESRDGGS